MRNTLGEAVSLKMVHPAVFARDYKPGTQYPVLFPSLRARLARAAKPGHLFYLYLTGPVGAVVGLVEVAGRFEKTRRDPLRPLEVPCDWVIGPKWPGVRLGEIGVLLRIEPGMNACALTRVQHETLRRALEAAPDMSQGQVEALRERGTQA